MVVTLPALLAGLAVARIRGTGLKDLGQMRGLLLLVAGVLVEAVAGGHLAANVAATVAFLAFAGMNTPAFPGAGALGLGFACNAVGLISGAGRMPVAASFGPAGRSVLRPAARHVFVAHPTPLQRVFGDVFVLRFVHVFVALSAGDMLIAAGIFVTVACGKSVVQTRV